MLAILEADRLGQLRTGGASGIATRYLAWPNAGTLALLGAGYQAETQLEAVAAVRPLRAVRVWSRTAKARESFAAATSRHLNLEITPVPTVREAVAGADIVTTITTAIDPILHGDDLDPGVHINAAGSNSATRAELDPSVIGRASRIFADDPAQAQVESGDLIRAHERNALNWATVRPLADVVAGLAVGRSSLEEITLFESHGLALWDIALAAIVYERAVTQGLGTVIPFGE